MKGQYRKVLLGWPRGFRLQKHMFTGSTQLLRSSKDSTDANTKTKTVKYLYRLLGKISIQLEYTNHTTICAFCASCKRDRAISNIASLAEAEPVKLHRDQDRCQDHNKVDQDGLT
jgi:hypothetical protein